MDLSCWTVRNVFSGWLTVQLFIINNLMNYRKSLNRGENEIIKF